jgi:hypothetical protein
VEIVDVKMVENYAVLLDSKGDQWRVSMTWEGHPQIQLLRRGPGKVTEEFLAFFRS